jgi:sugar-specific transcriptional regulator TrmB
MKRKYIRKQSGRPTKFIRIDPRTVIQTDVDTPDEVVRQRFADRQTKNLESLHHPPKKLDWFR